MTREQTGLAQNPVPGKASGQDSEGWVGQFSIQAERADGYAELYRSLGDEVRVELITSDLWAAVDCATCLLSAGDAYGVIYTQSRAGA